jgi:hypothetical protein
MAKKAKNENKAKATKKAPKQPKLPGVTTDRPVVNAKVEAAAEDFRETRDERMALTAVEAEKKEKLAEAMKAAGLTEYTYTIDDEETGEAKKLRVAYEEETETTLTVRTVKEKKAKAESKAAA